VKQGSMNIQKKQVDWSTYDPREHFKVTEKTFSEEEKVRLSIGFRTRNVFAYESIGDFTLWLTNIPKIPQEFVEKLQLMGYVDYLKRRWNGPGKEVRERSDGSVDDEYIYFGCDSEEGRTNVFEYFCRDYG